MKKVIITAAVGMAIFAATGIVHGNQRVLPTPAAGENLAYDTGAAWRTWLELMKDTKTETPSGKFAGVWPGTASKHCEHVDCNPLLWLQAQVEPHG